jgi:hypothetical protein
MRLLQYIAKVGWNEYETERKQQIQEEEKQIEIERRRNQEYQDYMNQYRKQMTEYQQAQTPPQKKAFPYPCGCHMAKGLEGWCGVAGGGVPACDH